jgi:hypothetical protein
VVIDLQHGGAVEADLPAMTSAIRLAGATPAAGVWHAHTADIGRALDLGCEGVIVPNVESAAQARQVARAVRYPPAGHRSVGGVLAVAEPVCLVMAESAAAVADLDAAIDESLRWLTPIGSYRRIVTRDISLACGDFAAGDRPLVIAGSAQPRRQQVPRSAAVRHRPPQPE